MIHDRQERGEIASGGLTSHMGRSCTHHRHSMGQSCWRPPSALTQLDWQTGHVLFLMQNREGGYPSQGSLRGSYRVS